MRPPVKQVSRSTSSTNNQSHGSLGPSNSTSSWHSQQGNQPGPREDRSFPSPPRDSLVDLLFLDNSAFPRDLTAPSYYTNSYPVFPSNASTTCALLTEALQIIRQVEEEEEEQQFPPDEGMPTQQ